MKLINENEYVAVSRLDNNTFLVWDKTSQVPTPHYYKTLKGALKKCASIRDNK